MGVVGPSLGLYVGNLQVLWGLLDPLWGCKLATYRSYGGCWTAFRAVCWQPTGLMGVVGPSLGLYLGNLQVLWGLFDRLWGCMLATYRSYGGCWTVFGAVLGVVGPSLGLYVGNLQVLWGLFDRLWGCMLATYRSYGGCWTVFGAVCWQPTGLMGLLDRLWGCMLATYGSYGGCLTVFVAVCWQPTGLMGVAGPSLRRYIGNLQVLWGLLDRLWGCMLATYRSCEGCWTVFGAVCWQPTGLMRVVGPSLGLYVGNKQVLWGLFDRLWGCMLATYRSYGGCLTGFGAVCWQPTGLVGVVGPRLGLYVGNLQVLWGLLTVFGAVCWQPTGLVGVVGPSLGLYVGNLQVLWGLFDRLWGCILATYRSYGGCLTVFGTVCWQPTGLMGVVGLSLGLYVGNLQVLWGLMGVVGPSLGLYVGNLQVLWGLMGVVGPSLGLYVGNLQVLWGLLDRLWGCMLATYRSYGGC